MNTQSFAVAIRFLKAFVETSRNHPEQSILVKLSTKLIERFESDDKLDGRILKAGCRDKQFRLILLKAIKSEQWQLASKICLEISAINETSFKAPNQRIASRNSIGDASMEPLVQSSVSVRS